MPRQIELKLIRPLLLLVAVGAILLAASGCGTSTADTTRGRALFAQRCGTCHALAEAGTSAHIGPDLDAAFAAARASGQDSDTIEGVVKDQVEYPRPDRGLDTVAMPADIVTGQNLDDVAAYVAEWAGVPGAAPPEVPGGAGAQVFANNGCGGCHTLAAAGSSGEVGPDLDEALVPDDSEAKIHEMIVDPNAEIAPGFPANVMPENFEDTIAPKELEDLVKFLIESTPAGKGKAGAKASGG
jgi:mono/diheme cytochrome c family protein